MLSFKIIESWFWRRFFEVFTIYGHGGHLGHMTCTIYINFCSPFPRRLHIKFGFDWQSGFKEDVKTLLTTTTTTPEQAYTVSSTCELDDSGELNIKCTVSERGRLNGIIFTWILCTSVLEQT